MNTSLFLARRLSLAAGGRRSSPAIRVAITAVALSVAIMMAAIAIVLGFKREIRDKVVGFNSHISLYIVPNSNDDSNLITLTPTLKSILDSKDYITDYTLQASIPAILKTPDNFKGVYLKNLDGKSLGDFIAKNLESGKIPDYSKAESEQKIVISRRAADQLMLNVGDKIDTYFISESVRVRRLEVAAIYNSHFDTYDNVFIYGSLPLIQSLGGISATQGTSVSITTNDFSNLEYNVQDLDNTLLEALAGGVVYRQYRTDNALNQGAGYFRWLSMLDTNVAVILVLMTIVACATLISGMLIIILDKKRFIGLVRSMGATVGNVRRIFIYMAIRVAVTGLILGNVLMLAILWAQQKWHLLPLDAEAYYIDFVPVELNWAAFLMLNIVTVIVIYLSLILPSWFAAKISPAETMRYE